MSETLTYVLIAAVAVLLVFYIMRRRARLRAEDSDQK
jgi:hypothetical protein